MKSSGLESSVLRYCLTFLAILLLASGAFAQSTTDGAIGGLVTDQSGAVVPGANVTARNPGTGATSSATTDGVGRYLIIHLQPGSYSLEIAGKGFAGYKATKIIVEVGRVTTVDASLGVQA